MAWCIRVGAECLFLFRSVGRIAAIRQQVFQGKWPVLMVSVAVLFSPALAARILSPYVSVALLVAMISIIAYAGMIYFRIAGTEERNWMIDSVRKFRS